MALNANLLRGSVQATLSPLGLYSPEAEELLLATAAQESLLGTYRVQVGGPALGIFQMEPATHDDIWANYLKYHTQLAIQIVALTPPGRAVPDDFELINNDPYAIAMARVQYLRAPGAIPPATSLTGLWLYYKQHYNTPLGAAKQIDFYRHYHELVQGPAR